ncbi:methyl-accepting chemotaxis protein [Treponema sp. OMZ 788]|uniref:methyl-accepting chemotaxis protein n=1 Tax=unclassified Treponema TaxID=2638727 RepID=UPI0020A4515A|nr:MULTISPECIES: methyl-accepting chemotaxis protein [unclassified Treponema]UTC63122.1 methyl-accepting chemotaxis protein [Treponema sp. OMZ 787]UTC64044.1 methyl-accepting chemotaxis protein [Treponema sp. OMZ 788]
MIEDKNAVDNFSDLIDKIVVHYNKGAVLGFVTSHSFDIIDEAMGNLQEKFETILSLFEEIQKESSFSAENTNKVDLMLAKVVEKRAEIQQEIHQRVDEIETTAQTAQTAASAFEVLKERTTEVEDMLSGIKDVSVRTGILAINASIEAARAGSVGNGFRIIANEVRSLATQTGDFAKKIEVKLEELNKSVEEINNSMTGFIELFSRFQKAFKDVLDNFDENSGTLTSAGSFLAEINASTREQDATIREGFASLKAIDGLVRDTVTILDVMQTTHDHLGTLLQQKDRS